MNSIVKLFPRSVFIFTQRYSNNSTNDKIKITWNPPIINPPQKNDKEKYSSLSYPDQLKEKKKDFKKFFKNVLITLDYDVKLDDMFKEKQQELGQYILDYVPDVMPLKNLDSSIYLTEIKLEIGYNHNDLKKKRVGKFFRSKRNNNILADEDEDEENNYWPGQMSNIILEKCSNKVKLIANHMEEFLSTDNLECKGGLSFNSKKWNWFNFTIRQAIVNNQTKLMLIVPLNPVNLDNTQIENKKQSLKEYFSTGSGKECQLDSFYFHLLKNQFKFEENAFNLLLGSDSLENVCDDKHFLFYPTNYYPFCFESYANLNKTLANMLEKIHQDSNNEIIIEFDTGNGVLGVMAKDYCKKFYSIQNNKHTLPAIEKNFQKYNLTGEYYTLFYNFSKTDYFFRTILKDHGENSRITVVYQSFSSNHLSPFNRTSKKDFLINLRKISQVKTILFVSNVAADFKLERYTYELMSAERKRNEIEGNPFYAVEARLVDNKPGQMNCYSIIRLQRD